MIIYIPGVKGYLRYMKDQFPGCSILGFCRISCLFWDQIFHRRNVTSIAPGNG